MSEAEFTSFLTRALALHARHSAHGALHFICMDWRHMGELLAAGHKVYSELKNLCIWAKDNGGLGSLYRSQHELVFVFKYGRESHRNNVQLGKYGRNRSNLWHYPGANSFSRNGAEGNQLALHPTVKPVALVADAIMDCTARRDLVLDGFLGSGTTVVAAQRCGRRCYGLEIDPQYVDTRRESSSRHCYQDRELCRKSHLPHLAPQPRHLLPFDLRQSCLCSLKESLWNSNSFLGSKGLVHYHRLLRRHRAQEPSRSPVGGNVPTRFEYGQMNREAGLL